MKAIQIEKEDKKSAWFLLWTCTIIQFFTLNKGFFYQKPWTCFEIMIFSMNIKYSFLSKRNFEMSLKLTKYILEVWFFIFLKSSISRLYRNDMHTNKSNYQLATIELQGFQIWKKSKTNACSTEVKRRINICWHSQCV